MATLSGSCPHCRHDKVVFDAVWNAQFQPPRPNLWHAYLVCRHCERGIGALFQFTNKIGTIDQGPASIRGDVFPTYRLEFSWPIAENLAAPEHTPPPAAKRFVEGEDAFARGNWNSAVAMYRAALDIATKGIDGVPKLSFYDRLKWMRDKELITEDIKQWADHVRVEGNSALHDPEDFSEEDAIALRYFTEMFLRYVFEMPGRVSEFRQRLEK